MSSENLDGWNSWGNFVLNELKRQNESIEKLREEIKCKQDEDIKKWTKFAVEMAKQEINNSRRTKFYSIISGVLVLLISAAMAYLM